MPKTEDLIFNPHGRRHYRRRYSLGEAKASSFVLGGLALVGAYIAYLGAHPGPERAQSVVLDPGTQASSREPLPEGLASAQFVESAVRHFDASNLYEKINGRAGYFTARGFQRLSHAVLTLRTDPSVAVDVELYDMASADNALSAYNGERNPSLAPQKAKAGLSHQDENALYLTHGQYYLRAIGSEASERVSAQLVHLKRAIEEGLAVEKASASLASVFDALEISPGDVRFQPENAFSFGFAKNVYIAKLTDDAELFVAAGESEEAASALATQFVDGFASLGEIETQAGQRFVKDRYLSTFSAARAQRSIVLGISGSPTPDAANAELARLSAAIEKLPAPVIADTKRALTESSAKPAGGSYPDEGASAPEATQELEPAPEARPNPAYGTESVGEPSEPAAKTEGAAIKEEPSPLPEQAPAPDSYGFGSKQQAKQGESEEAPVER